MSVLVSGGTGAPIATREDRAPAALLVRPDGRVRIDSLHPFSFGNALEDGLAECWERIREGWRAPEITEWADGISSSTGLGNAGLVPYLDEEAELGRPVPASRSEEQRRRTAGQKVLQPGRARAPGRPGGGGSRGARARALARAVAPLPPRGGAGERRQRRARGAPPGRRRDGPPQPDRRRRLRRARRRHARRRRRVPVRASTPGSRGRGSRTTCWPSPGGSRAPA